MPATWGVQVCASAAERNWSVYGRIKTKDRSRMSHETGDMLVYCHEVRAGSAQTRKAVKLPLLPMACAARPRITGAAPQGQDADGALKAKVEKWDSDSDSDEMDEEDLKV